MKSPAAFFLAAQCTRIWTVCLLAWVFAAQALGQTNADVRLAVSGSPMPVDQGNPFTFTIVVTNAGPENLDLFNPSDASLNHGPASACLANVQLTPSAGTVDGDYWYFGSLPKGQTRTLTISGIAATQGTNTAALCAHVPTGMDPNTNNNAATLSFLVEPRVDVVIYKNPIADPIIVGQNFQYGVIVTNRGPGTAENLVITDLVPEGFEVLGVSYAAGSATNENGTITWNLPFLSTLGEYSLWVDARCATAGTYTNRASVTNDWVDTNLSNNQTALAIVVNAEDPADLETFKSSTLEDPEVPVGAVFEFNIGVRNHGPAAAANAVVSDTVPDGFSIFVSEENIGGRDVEVSGNTITWRLGEFQSGAEDSLWYQATAQTSGTYTNRVAASSDTEDHVPDNNQAEYVVTVRPPVIDAGISVELSPNPVDALWSLDVNLTVTNHGEVDLENVVVTNTLPAGCGWKDSVDVPEGASWSHTSGVVTVEFGTLPAGWDSWATIHVDAPSYGPGTNVATVSSSSGDGNPDNDLSEEVLEVVSSADLSVWMDPTPDHFTAGVPAAYRVWVSNAGPSAAAAALCTITLPHPSSLDSVQASAGTWTNENGQLLWDLGLMASGFTEYLDLTVIHLANGNPTNLAVVSTLSADANDGNDLYMDITEVNGAPELVLTPAAATNAVLASHYLEARVTTNGVGMAGVNLAFSVWRGPMTGFTTNVATDPLGIARMIYVNPRLPGLDRIAVSGTANALPLAADATARWVYADTTLFLTNGLEVAITTGCVDVPLVIEPNLRIDELRVLLHLEHDASEDLIVSLIGPAPFGPERELFRNIAGGGFGTQGNPPDFLLDDYEGAALAGGGPAPYTGAFATPSAVLEDYFGAETRGTWILRICDTNPGRGTGILRAWGLAVDPLDDDLNDDGISDTWQAAFWPDFDPDAEGPNPWDPGTDANNNGIPNEKEFRTGYSPTDTASRGFAFSWAPGMAGEHPVIEWPSQSNQYYRIYRSTNLTNGFEILLGGIPATEPLNVHTDRTAVGTAYFYTVEQEE